MSTRYLYRPQTQTLIRGRVVQIEDRPDSLEPHRIPPADLRRSWDRQSWYHDQQARQRVDRYARVAFAVGVVVVVIGWWLG